MAATNDPDSLPSIRANLSGYTAPDTVPTALYPPSPVDAKYYYYSIPSQPLLVACSSANIWVEPTGVEAYLLTKEYSPIGSHPRDLGGHGRSRHGCLFGLQGGEVYESRPCSHGPSWRVFPPPLSYG